MLPKFQDKEQKKDCLDALTCVIKHWSIIAEHGTTKDHAIDILREMSAELGYGIPEEIPYSDCYLCDYVEKQTKKRNLPPKEGSACGMNCQALCPVIWDPVKNPQNRDIPEEKHFSYLLSETSAVPTYGKDEEKEPPCESFCSAYGKYMAAFVNAWEENPEELFYPETIEPAKDMVKTLKEAKTRCLHMAVETKT